MNLCGLLGYWIINTIRYKLWLMNHMRRDLINFIQSKNRIYQFYIIFYKKTIKYIDNKIFLISNRQDIELDINEINSFGYEVVKLREIEHHVKINIFIDSYNIYFECSDNKNLEKVLLNLLKNGIPQVEGKKKQLLIDNNKKIKF